MNLVIPEMASVSEKHKIFYSICTNKKYLKKVSSTKLTCLLLNTFFHFISGVIVNIFLDASWCICVMRCAIWHHLYNFKNVKNTHGGVLILILLKLTLFHGCFSQPATLLKLTLLHGYFSRF